MTDINRYVVLRARPDPEVTADLFVRTAEQ